MFISNLFSRSTRKINGFKPFLLTFKSSSCCYHKGYNNDDFNLSQPSHFNLVTDIIHPWCNQNKTALTITDGNNTTSYSYDKLYLDSRKLSSALTLSEDSPRCALVILPKVYEWWVANVAASWSGMVISPGTSMLTPKDVSHRLNRCNADAIICSNQIGLNLLQETKNIPHKIYTGKYDQILNRNGWKYFDELLTASPDDPSYSPSPTKSDDIAQIFFTSGTTGYPKMVPHTQASLGVGHRTTSRLWLDLKPSDCIWNLSDTGWAKAAYSSLYAPFIAGATAFIHQMAKFDAEEMIRTLCESPVSVLCAPPTAYRALVQCDLKGFQPRCLRHCVSAGEPLNPEVMAEWKKYTGLDIYEGFGQSETTLLCGTFIGMDIKPGSMGVAAPGYEVKVLDENFNEVQIGEEGYIAVDLREGWPTGLFKGYLDDENKNKEAFKEDFYFTGDRGYIDKDNYFWFVGRADDVIISSGYRIGPFEVESALLEHDAVAETAVVASPDPIRGEVVKAFIVLSQSFKKHGTTELIKELQEHMKRITAPYKYPRKIEFVEVLPKTISGKIKRNELRARERRS